MDQRKTLKLRREKSTATTIRYSIKKRLEKYIRSQSYPPKEVDIVSTAVNEFLDRRGA